MACMQRLKPPRVVFFSNWLSEMPKRRFFFISDVFLALKNKTSIYIIPVNEKANVLQTFCSTFAFLFFNKIIYRRVMGKV
jgi:hypothetical protein